MNLDSLNNRQREAVLYTEGPLLVMAGAGSGKTRVLTQRIAYLIEEKGVMPYNILALTFTNKAAQEMKDRITNAVGVEARDVWAGTFHSVCAKILRIDGAYIGYSSDFAIYDQTDQTSLIKKIIKSLNIKDEDLKPKFVLSEISRAKNAMVDAEQYQDNLSSFDEKREHVAKIYKLYQDHLKKNNAMDFNDLILKTLELFKANPEVEKKYARRFEYIHVDEYQDTNLPQYFLVRLLSLHHGNICVVGDSDQSIYSWRGADIRNINEFEKDFAGAKVVKLEQNYRSTSNILDLANAVIANNTGRIEKALWTQKKGGTKPKYYCAKSGGDEARYVLSQILKGYDEGRKFSDFAIMYRTNSQSSEFEQVLMQYRIPYKIVGGLKFFQRLEIKDVHAYLRLVVNPDDSVAGMRVINSPKRGIGAKSVERILQYADVHNLGFMDAIKDCINEGLFKGKALQGLKDFVNVIDSAREGIEDKKPSELLAEILDMSGYTLALLNENTKEAMARVENIDELVSQVMNRENKEEGLTLGQYLEDISLMSEQDDINSAVEDKVLLMTLHSAKGLEFPVVFLVGLEEGIFPSFYAEAEGNLDEERRLCYVGITRAEEELYITHAEFRFRFGKQKVNRASIFIEEMPEDMLESKNGRIKKDYVKNQEKVSRVKTKANITKPVMVNEYSADDFMIGTKIKHSFFGKGTIIKIDKDGDDAELVVAFDSKGIKKLLLSMSQIDILS